MGKPGPTVKLPETEIVKYIENSLATLAEFARLYDDGHHHIAFSMATEVTKILTANSVAIRMRAENNYLSPKNPYSERNIMPELKLIRVYVGGAEPGVEFHPVYRDCPEGVERLKFNVWWNRDVIYRASARRPDLAAKYPPWAIPMREEERVPYHKRATLTREKFVRLMRNKFGAHLDEEIPEELDNLQKSKSFGVVLSIQTPSGMMSTEDGSLPMRIGPAAAMMRQIAFEVLEAYGRL